MLSNEVIVISSISLSIGYLGAKLMDSKLAASLSTLANNTSALTKAITDFIAANANPPITATELTSVLSSLDTANSSIASAITQLTPSTVTVTDTPSSAIGTVNTPAPPSSTL